MGLLHQHQLPHQHQVHRAQLPRETISVFSRTATTSQGLVNWTRRHATAHAAQDPAHHRHPAKEIICAGLANAMKSRGMAKWIRTHARAPAQRLKSWGLCCELSITSPASHSENAK